MNYKIAKTMLVLCVVYLIGFYILKFIFPELLLQTITSPTVLQFGEFLKKSVFLEYLFSCISGIITYYLFACASSGKYKFNYKCYISFGLAEIISLLVMLFQPNLYTHTSISLMFLIAFICNGKLSYTVISFIIHGYLSQFLLSIRGFETVIIKFTEIGALGGLILGFEMYVWLILLSIIFFLKENKNEHYCTPVS